MTQTEDTLVPEDARARLQQADADIHDDCVGREAGRKFQRMSERYIRKP